MNETDTEQSARL